MKIYFRIIFRALAGKPGKSPCGCCPDAFFTELCSGYQKKGFLPEKGLLPKKSAPVELLSGLLQEFLLSNHFGNRFAEGGVCSQTLLS